MVHDFHSLCPQLDFAWLGLKSKSSVFEKKIHQLNYCRFVRVVVVVVAVVADVELFVVYRLNYQDQNFYQKMFERLCPFSLSLLILFASVGIRA